MTLGALTLRLCCAATVNELDRIDERRFSTSTTGRNSSSSSSSSSSDLGIYYQQGYWAPASAFSMAGWLDSSSY